MDWKIPAVVEIKMDAEIGSYQEERDPAPEPWSGIAVPRRPAKRQENRQRIAARLNVLDASGPWRPTAR